MFSNASLTAKERVPGPSVLCRPVFAAVLLAAEAAALSFLFDTGAFLDRSAWWQILLVHSASAVRFSVTAAALAMLFSSVKGGADALQFEMDESNAPRWLVIHFAALAVFTALTWRLFETAGDAPMLVLSWACAGVLTASTLFLAAWPWSRWLKFVREARWGLCIAFVGGLAALGVSRLSQSFWLPLSQATLVVSRQLLLPLYPAATYDLNQSILATPDFEVEISPECSGYEGMGLIAIVVTLYLCFFRTELRFPRALALLPVGIAAAWLLNTVRIAALVAVGSSWSEAVACGGFHSQAGWLSFNALGLGVILLSSRTAYFSKTRAAAPLTVNRDAREGDLTVAYLAPLVAALAASTATELVTPGIGWRYPARFFAGALAVIWFRRAYTVFSPNWSWHSIALGCVGFGVWLAIVPADASGAGPFTIFASLPPVVAPCWLALRIVGYCVLTPFIEEVAFRGYFVRRLIDVRFDQVPLASWSWPAAVASSVLFGALHGNLLAGSLAGFCYAIAAWRRGNLFEAVVAHVTTNSLLAIYALSSGSDYLLS